jgi:hypothetical protein
MSMPAASVNLARRFVGLVVLGTVAATMALVVGCAGSGRASNRPPPLQPPRVAAAVVHRAGGPDTTQSATRPASVAVDGADALDVTVEWIALSAIPDGLPPLASQARLIAAPRAANPLLATARLSRGARVVSGEKLDAFHAELRGAKRVQSVAIATSAGALPPGVTAAFDLADANAGADATEARVGVDVYRPTGATTRGAATQPSPDVLHVSLALDDGKMNRERLSLDPLAAPVRLALVVPSLFASDRARAVLAVVTVNPPADSPEHRDAVARCNRELQGVAAATPRPTVAPSGGGASPGISATLSALETAARARPPQPARVRAALVYLAGETSAELLGDVALVASPATLHDLCQRIASRLGESPNRMDRDAIGWHLEAATLETLSALQAAETLPPELAGVLARFAGEAARNAGSLDELAKQGSRAQLAEQLIAENFTYLEDASPSSRVRAYDWLVARRRAPANYDPLGPARQRAAAIDAAVTAAASQPAGGAR